MGDDPDIAWAKREPWDEAYGGTLRAFTQDEYTSVSLRSAPPRTGTV